MEGVTREIDKDSIEAAKEETENPETKKRGRGRPRKDHKDREEAAKMKNFLLKGSCGYVVNFGEKKRVEHSPLRNGSNGEDNGTEKDEIAEERVKEKESSLSGDENEDDESGNDQIAEDGEIREGQEAVDKDAEEENKKGVERTTDGKTEQQIKESNRKNLEKEIGELRKELETVKKESGEKEKVYEQSNKAWKILVENMANRIVEMNERWEEEIKNLKEEMKKLGNKEEQKQVQEADKDEGSQNEEDETEKEDKEENKEEQEEDLKGKEYLDEMPDKLGEEEYEYEKKERLSRKKNLFIRGIRTVGKGIKEEVGRLVKEKMNLPIYVKKVRPIGGGIVVELESLGNKIEIMKKRVTFQKMGISVEDDFTEREKEVMNWLRKLEEQETALGERVKVGYLKVQIYGDWYDWDEREGTLVRQGADNTFRSTERERARERRKKGGNRNEIEETIVSSKK